MKNKILMLSLLTFAVAATSGCAGVSQAVNAYGSIAVTGAKAANDTLIEANKVALCATPIGALARHPELVPAVRSLCVPAKDAGNVGVIIDTIEAQAAPASK